MKRLIICLSVFAFCSLHPVNGLAKDAKKSDPVRDFVSGIYQHGVPYKEARSLGREALPELEAMLRDDAYRPYWQTIAPTICYIGEPASFPVIKEFLLTRFKGELNSDTFFAMLGIMTSLGPLAARSDPAFEFLVNGTDPTSWSPVSWSYQNLKGDRLRVQLSKLSINSLGLTGRREAKAVLEKLQREPFDNRQANNIELGLGTQREVEDVGIEGYFERHRGAGTEK